MPVRVICLHGIRRAVFFVGRFACQFVRISITVDLFFWLLNLRHSGICVLVDCAAGRCDKTGLGLVASNHGVVVSPKLLEMR